MLQKIVSTCGSNKPNGRRLISVVPWSMPKTPLATCTVVVAAPAPGGIQATGACSLRCDSTRCFGCSSWCLRLQEWSCSSFGRRWLWHEEWCWTEWGVRLRGAWSGCVVESSGTCVSFCFAFSLGCGRDRGVGLLTSGTSCLCCGALLLFAFKVAPNQWKVFLIQLFEEC